MVRPAGKSGLSALVVSTWQVSASAPMLLKTMAGLTSSPASRVRAAASANAGAANTGAGLLTVIMTDAVDEPAALVAVTL